MARTSPCTRDVRSGRLRKAGRFLDAANLIADQGGKEAGNADAFITLCIHAGIAASDIICCCRLGQHAQGDSHNEALTMLGQADSGSVKHLRVLLSKDQGRLQPHRSNRNRRQTGRTGSGGTPRNSPACERRIAEGSAVRLHDPNRSGHARTVIRAVAVRVLGIGKVTAGARGACLNLGRDQPLRQAWRERRPG
jgi:hypothetical protein